MDPVTIWLFVLAVMMFVRRGVEDGIAAYQGRESPRIARRRAQHELAQRQLADTGRPTIGQAVTGRIADRIAEPREPGAFRRFLAELWADAWVDAADGHRNRRAARARPSGPRQAMASRLCAGGCGRWVSGEWTHCSGCEDDLNDGHDWWGEDHPDEHDEASDQIEDAELVDEPEPHDFPPDPGPAPAPDSHRKDTPPTMTAPVIISGEIGSPEEALGFCDSSLAVIRAANAALDMISGNLGEEGVGDGPLLRSISDASDDLDAVTLNLCGASEEYEGHVATQAELLADPELRNTLVNYLSARRAGRN